MNKNFRDYFWKDGIPYGIEPVTDTSGTTYKIIMDPYRKRISIEKYSDGLFVRPIYDSALVNFRHLTPEEQAAWHKTTVKSEPTLTICHIRNQDDRLIFIETYRFHGNLCRECLVQSPHGIPISIQRMYYETLGDLFNGVILFDTNEHPVVAKKYTFDSAREEFTDLLQEEWNMQNKDINQWQKSISSAKT